MGKLRLAELNALYSYDPNDGGGDGNPPCHIDWLGGSPAEAISLLDLSRLSLHSITEPDLLLLKLSQLGRFDAGCRVYDPAMEGPSAVLQSLIRLDDMGHDYLVKRFMPTSIGILADFGVTSAVHRWWWTLHRAIWNTGFSTRQNAAVASFLKQTTIVRDVCAKLLWRYLTTPDVAWSRYATLRGWWADYDDPQIPPDFASDVQWADVEDALNNHPWRTWAWRNKLALPQRTTRKQVRGQAA